MCAEGAVSAVTMTCSFLNDCPQSYETGCDARQDSKELLC